MHAVSEPADQSCCASAGTGKEDPLKRDSLQLQHQSKHTQKKQTQNHVPKPFYAAHTHTHTHTHLLLISCSMAAKVRETSYKTSSLATASKPATRWLLLLLLLLHASACTHKSGAWMLALIRVAA